MLSIFKHFEIRVLKFQKNVDFFPGIHIHIPNTRGKCGSYLVLFLAIKKQISDSI